MQCAREKLRPLHSRGVKSHDVAGRLAPWRLTEPFLCCENASRIVLGVRMLQTRLASALLLCLSMPLSACGGSSSETPYPLEPDPNHPASEDADASRSDSSEATSPEIDPDNEGPEPEPAPAE
jgi:hypothetical protein